MILIKALTYLALAGLAVQLSFADVQWTRLIGKVKGVNGKTQQVTIQNKEGDLLTVKIDPDVKIMRDKGAIPLKDVELDERVTLLFLPTAPSGETDEPPVGGFYPPAKK